MSIPSLASFSSLNTGSDRSRTARDFVSPYASSFSPSLKSQNKKTTTTMLLKTMKKTKKTDEDKVENNNRRGQRERRKVLKAENSSRRDFVSWMTLLLAHSNAMFLQTGHKISAFAEQQQQQQQQTFTQRFPTLFKPFLGEGTKKTIKTTLVEDRCWALEQTIELGPLETPLRCVVVRLSSGDLWVHNPLAPD